MSSSAKSAGSKMKTSGLESKDTAVSGGGGMKQMVSEKMEQVKNELNSNK